MSEENCPKCGIQLAEGAKFCTGCGQIIDPLFMTEEDPTISPPPPPPKAEKAPPPPPPPSPPPPKAEKAPPPPPDLVPENSDSVERLDSFLAEMEDIFQKWKEEIDFGSDEDIFSSAKTYSFSAIKLQEMEVEGLVIELDEDQSILEPEVDFID